MKKPTAKKPTRVPETDEETARIARWRASRPDLAGPLTKSYATFDTPEALQAAVRWLESLPLLPDESPPPPPASPSQRARVARRTKKPRAT